MTWYLIIGGIIGLIILIYFLNYWLYKKKTEYGSKSYWESRYDWYRTPMDWYANYSKSNEDFKIEQIISENFPHKSKSKLSILELGCGNSDWANDMVNKGYTNYIAIDYSLNVIKQMREKYSKPEFCCVDFTQLENTFEPQQFDIIIEKAGLDSIATKGTPEVPDLLYAVYRQIYYVLKNDGIFLSISSKNTTFWKTNVMNKAIEEGMFQLVQARVTTFTVPKNPMLMNYYFHYLKIGTNKKERKKVLVDDNIKK